MILFSKNHGFTIIELIAVILIMGKLSALPYQSLST